MLCQRMPLGLGCVSFILFCYGVSKFRVQLRQGDFLGEIANLLLLLFYDQLLAVELLLQIFD